MSATTMEFLMPKPDIIVNSECNNVLIKYQIPFEIKNDIIYCQKALRSYLKVHQMVFLNYGQKLSLALPTVRKLVDDLEREIYEINAEQRFLIYRLRKSLEDFYKSLPVNNIVIDREADNTFLRHSFSKYVDDPNYPCEAISVKSRKTFNQWKRKFSLDDPKRLLLENNKNATQTVVPTTTAKTQISPNSGNANGMQNGLPKQRVSLLKPKFERDLARMSHELDQSVEVKHEEDNTRMFEATVSDRIMQNHSENNISEAIDDDEKPEVDKINSKLVEEAAVPPQPSSAINIGRMKLLQALNKAKNQKEIPPVQPAVSNTKVVAAAAPKATSVPKSPEQTQKLEKFVEVTSSSSDDSLDGINALPPIEPEKSGVSQINQEMFLRQFGLYTMQHSAYLKQRRSKRRRRNVQFNERKDFHYGTLNFNTINTIDAQTSMPKEKKKKIFLASPTVTRKSNKRRRSAKDEIAAASKANVKTDRSSTSSPDEKQFCNVCFRNNKEFSLSQCKKCKQNYHISCHSKFGVKSGNSIIKKMCPICIRAKKSSRSASSEDFSRQPNESTRNGAVRRSSLIDQCNVLKQKIVTAQSRKSNLLRESQAYKTKMNELFNIVHTIKNQKVKIETKPETILFEIEISDDEEDAGNASEKYSTPSSSQPDSAKEKCRENTQALSADSADDAKQSEKQNQFYGYNTNEEIVDSDDEILVIKEDANVIEIQDNQDQCGSDVEM